MSNSNVSKKTLKILNSCSFEIMEDLSLTNHEIADKLSFMGVLVRDIDIRGWFVIKGVPRWDQKGKRCTKNKKVIDNHSIFKYDKESPIPYGHRCRDSFKR